MCVHLSHQNGVQLETDLQKKKKKQAFSASFFFLIIISAIFYNFNIFVILNMGEFLTYVLFKNLFFRFKVFFYFNTICVFHTWGSQGSKKKSTKMSLTEFLADQCMYDMKFCCLLLINNNNSKIFLKTIATGSWADEMEDLPSAREFII